MTRNLSVFGMLALIGAAACDAGGGFLLPPRPGEGIAVTAVEPLEGFAGDEVVVRGDGFGVDAASIEVQFNGYGARPHATNETGTELRVHVPAGIASGQVTVVNNRGRATSAASFRYRGAGALQRGSVAREYPLLSDLGALAVYDDHVFVLSAATHQIVELGPALTRIRLDEREPPTGFASALASGNRLVYVTPTKLIAVEIKQNRTLGTATEWNLEPELPLFKVEVGPDGHTCIAASARSIFRIDLNSSAIPTSGALPPGVLFSDGTARASGRMYAVARTADGTAGIFTTVEKDELEPSHVLSLPAALSVVLALEIPGKDLHAVATANGGLLFIEAAGDPKVASAAVDLLGGAPASALVQWHGLVLGTIPEKGRLVAVDIATQRLAWSLELGGAPTNLVVDPEDRVHVSNRGLNLVQVVDPVSRTLLGERHVGPDIGSSLGGPNGLVFHELDAPADGQIPALILALSRGGNSITGIDPTTLAVKTVGMLGDGSQAFAATPSRWVVVAHDDGKIGLVDLRGSKRVVRESGLCKGNSDCPAASERLVAIEALKAVNGVERVLLATTARAQVRTVPDWVLEHEELPEAGTRFIDASSTGAGLALVSVESDDSGARLRFGRLARSAAGTWQATTFEEKAATGRKVLPLGVASLRGTPVTGELSPVFFFLRLTPGGPKPWLYAPDRPSQALFPSPPVGITPQFSPNGRQLLGTPGQGDALAGTVLLSQGDMLSQEGMTPQGVVDVGGTPSAIAFQPNGERAFVVLGDEDRLVVLE